MSRFKALQKMLGIVSDDAAKVLEKIDNPELATSLKGQERAEYLQVLDEVYGNTASERAATMGFGNKTQLNNFDPRFLKQGVNLPKQKATKSAMEILNKIDTAEKAVALRGKERAEYLAALDEVYGPREKRAKDMGFGGTTWYHGTEADISEFNPVKLGEKTTGITRRLGHHFAKNPKVASSYAEQIGGNVIPVRIRTKGGQAYYPEGGSLSPEDALLAKESILKTGGRPVIFKDAQDALGSNTTYSDIAIVPMENDIRSVYAAFDPRFKDSALLMAGAGAIPQADINPMEALKGIKENIAEPVVEKYNKLKSYVTGPLARQMNLSKDPEIEKGLKQGLDMGLDPVNLIPGGAGVGAGLLQLLGEKDEEE